jgi:hypothetical protein
VAPHESPPPNFCETLLTEIYPWQETTEPLTLTFEKRGIAIDVNGDHVVFTISGEANNPGWSTMADQLIDSFRFQTE